MNESFLKERDEMLVWQIIGPLSLLCAFILSAKGPLPYDLYLASLVGLFFSARWHFRGCFYALAILICLGIFKHWTGDLHHFWRLGLEGSIAASLFITALAFESSSEKLETLHSQLNAKQAALGNVEEDLVKTREEAAQQQLLSAQKIDGLQKDLEESVAEKGSFEVLNDVLRKVTARHVDEKKFLEEHLIQDKRDLAQSQSEIETLKKEVSDFKKSQPEVEKRELMNELNETRIEKEQSHLINEKLVRLHAKESLRAKEALDQLQAMIEEKKVLQNDLRQAIQEADVSVDALKKITEEREKHAQALDQMGRLHQEKLFLKERIRAAEMELSLLKKTPEEMEAIRQERDALADQLMKAQEKMNFLSKLEPLHRQLKAQFEEKNKVLHETRAALFTVDTELQTLKMEREQKNLQFNPLPEGLSQELVALDREMSHLQAENEELQKLVSHLMVKMPGDGKKNSLTDTLNEALSSIKRKKRVKSREQDMFF
jgi:hypothetical protein